MTSPSADPAASAPREPEYPTLHGSRFEVLSDFWFVFADSTRNSLRLNAVPWNRVMAVTAVALCLSGALDWYLPGSQLGTDVGATLLTGIIAIVGYAIRAGLTQPKFDAAASEASTERKSSPTKSSAA